MNLQIAVDYTRIRKIGGTLRRYAIAYVSVCSSAPGNASAIASNQKER